MAYKQKGMKFHDHEDKKTVSTQADAPKGGKENVTYGVGTKTHTTYGTTYYNADGSKVKNDIDGGELSKINKGTGGRRYVTHSNGKKYYLSSK